MLSAGARRAGGPNGSPSGGRGPRAGARRPEAGAGENRLLNPLLAAAVAPRDAAGAGGGVQGVGVVDVGVGVLALVVRERLVGGGK